MQAGVSIRLPESAAPVVAGTAGPQAPSEKGSDNQSLSQFAELLGAIEQGVAQSTGAAVDGTSQPAARLDLAGAVPLVPTRPVAVAAAARGSILPGEGQQLAAHGIAVAVSMSAARGSSSSLNDSPLPPLAAASGGEATALTPLLVGRGNAAAGAGAEPSARALAGRQLAAGRVDSSLSIANIANGGLDFGALEEFALARGPGSGHLAGQNGGETGARLAGLVTAAGSQTANDLPGVEGRPDSQGTVTGPGSLGLRGIATDRLASGGPLQITQPRAFGDGLANQVTLMIGTHNNQARIAVSPPELGPIDVRVRVDGDDVSVQLAAVHASSREALEDALPRLRSALQDAGFELGESGVFEHLPQQGRQGQDDPEHDRFDRTAARPDAVAAGHDGNAEPAGGRRVSLALVDAFV